jgi:hypothetical protein
MKPVFRLPARAVPFVSSICQANSFFTPRFQQRMADQFFLDSRREIYRALSASSREIIVASITGPVRVGMLSSGCSCLKQVRANQILS